MFKQISACAILLWCCGIVTPAFAQNIGCTPSDQTITRGEVFFNYGSATDAYSIKNRSSYSLGEPIIGVGISQEFNSQIGFWSRFLIPPLAPAVTATQGELLDRIQVSWSINPLGAQASDGFKLYRDGVFLAAVDKKTENFNDFNVIAGRAYNYEVRGVNSYGEGVPGKALGFQVPNGVVTGWVQTVNGNPVPNALITLMPMQGFSAKFGPTDGALADTTGSGLASMLPTTNDPWTITFWIKTNAGSTANAGILQFQPFPFNMRNTASGQEGIAVDMGGAPLCSANFPAATKNDWHHVALSYDGTLRLFIDGTLSALAPAPFIPSAIDLKIGARTDSSGWAGLLDELRIYHRHLDEIDLGEVMEGTASSFTQGLQFYWKMDEEKGVKSFDVIHRTKLFFCGAAFNSDRPAVRTAATTNNEGYYRIESASYGTGTTFLAEPMKHFYLHRALKFVRSMSHYATLPDFAMPPQATLETWVNSGGPDGEQCLLSKRWPSNDFRLLLKPNGTDNDVVFYLNGQEHNFGLLGMGYQHLAFTIDSSGNDRIVTAYKNGAPFGTTSTFSGVTGNWSDSTANWMIGARPSGASQTGYFGGLIDEIAVYDTTLAQNRILEHFQHSRSPQERGLRVYFAFDEGTGSRLYNAGSLLIPSGTKFGPDWITFSPNQVTSAHLFTPKTRQVTLNPSVTSVDQVDFTDRSTIGVSGFVRYQNTDCFAKSIEILVNGTSFDPPIFTDSTGRFVADFEPGFTATLTPKFEDHTFVPAFWDVANVSTPISGILFNDTKTRRITGQIAGGNCKKSIISGIAENCRIKLRSKNGCYEKEMQITATDGKYEFNNLPPVEVTIAVINHNNPVIHQDFQSQGGRTINLATKDSLGVDFIYVAPPQLEVTGFEPFVKTDCPGQPIVLHQLLIVSLDIKAFGQYGPGQDPAERCYLDTATLTISNSFDNAFNVAVPLVKGISDAVFKYDFIVNNPNEIAPHTRIIEITADDKGKKSSPYTNFAIIEGTIIGEAKFTTALPMVPTCVLHDPPGDGSYAFLEKESKICNTIEIENSGGAGLYFANELTVGVNPTFNVGASLGLQGSIEVEFILTLLAGVKIETMFSYGKQTSMEYCTTFNERVSTDDGDLIVGGATALDVPADLSKIDTLPGNDVYIGTGFNFIFSDSKRISFNDTICGVNLDNVVTGALDLNKVTYYKYSEWNIVNNVIRYLDTLYQNGIQQDSVEKSIKSWKSYIKMNQESKKKAKLDKNISFDSGVQYESFMALDTTNATNETYNQDILGSLYAFLDLGVVKPLVGLEHAEEGINWYSNNFQKYGKTRASTLTTGYVLKDDDPGDTWSVDIKTDPLYGTPVFEIIAGQSSCPWELGTAHREAVALISKDGTQRTNVPSNEAAVFHFDLGNRSSTFEDGVYDFNTEPENNPDGAVIKLNGAVLDHPISYPVAYGQTVPITLTVERGPQAYSYKGLKVSFSSGCHYERCNTPTPLS
ncbi:MAG: LamG domain-containing protein [Saprospiraceae bacterium]|nr:LamG domain-containing protein [Saprospiraceae bacterium]